MINGNAKKIVQPYKKLFTYWYATIIYDRTVEFTERWIESWKLKEQMNGAARSGKQNIVEGSDSLKISVKSAIKLTGVAKSSFEELIGDLEDFLRQRDLARWDKIDKRVLSWRVQSARLVRSLSNLRNLRESASQTQEKERALLAQLPLPEQPEEATNFLLTLCHQETYLLNNQVGSLEKKHEREGGFTEKLYQRRKNYRGY